MKKWKNGIIAIMVLILLITVTVLAKLFLTGNINSVNDLQEYMKKFGVFAPIVFTLFQAAQVVVPVLPGFLGCIAGPVMFGTFTGFLCNYIGISIGSIIAFFLARKFGIDIVLLMFSKETYDKWSGKLTNSKYYDIFLFVATLLPVFPDDFFCYFSGLIKMNWKKFVWIIILGKPWCILAYSLLSETLVRYVS